MNVVGFVMFSCGFSVNIGFFGLCIVLKKDIKKRKKIFVDVYFYRFLIEKRIFKIGIYGIV